MKVLPFTILVPKDKSVITEYIELPHFYQYLHRHDEWQITYVESGEGTLIAGNDMHAFRPGDVFVIGAKLPHLFKSNAEYFADDSEKVIKACSVYFNPSGILASLFGLPEMKMAKAFLDKNKHGFKVPYGFTEDIMKQIFTVHKATGIDVLFSFVKLMNTLQDLNENVERLCSDLYSSNFSENEGMRLSKIINFITDNYTNPISLEDVANTAFMTPQAFCRYFKKHTGHTFISFLNEVRINAACKSLTTGEKADCISGVAYKTGFNSITNFNRVFKSIIGQSPKSYIDSYNSVSKVNHVNY
ncbi:helix-turn-helix domain-containing protein [Chryseobacterium sp. L7]|uniref:Helix-turn-helix domain-containing protein n=1 Tax=Chryseobacterium endalhagicum TaxID=2797638 RepID=A0ABS1QLD6_9FLAO|nr:AraC family transcriptional regulator [Chryseobacterium endalhagicum]MBL1223431.1 helix-turn-helix domain-containing protein [Chryseobacterium endalhagicum]